MSSLAFTVFDSAIGRCALVWRGDLVVGAALPEEDDAQLLADIRRRFPEAAEAPPPPAVAQAVALVIRHLDGQDVDLAAIAVDLYSAQSFEQRVYAETRAIPNGEVRTYGELAASLGQPGAARAVGMALGRNPIPIIIPCHRIVASSGRSGGFSAPGGARTKFRILAIEGARRSEDSALFDFLPLAIKPQDRSA